jgi:hypothetical protein
MGTVEPTGVNSGDEKLRAIRVLSSIGHGKKTRLIVLELEVFIYPRRLALASWVFHRSHLRIWCRRWIYHQCRYQR